MIHLQKKSSYKLINRIKRWFWVTRAEPDMPVLFTHCGFMAIMLLAAPSQSVIAPSLSVILMIDPHITNYTAQRCPSSHSSTPTFINILLVSLGAAHFIPPLGKKKKSLMLLLLLFKSPNLPCNKNSLCSGLRHFRKN